MSLQGSLDARGHPRISIRVRGPYGSEVVSAVVDTGFTGAFSLPGSLISRLGLLRRGSQPSVLADGTFRIVPVFLAEVDWVDAVEVCELLSSNGPDATVGAGLLRGHQLFVDYGPAQTVGIR